MDKYKVAIVEDDPLSQQMLQDLIERSFPDFRVCATFSSVNDAVAELEMQQVNLLLLDMELGDGRGFDVLKRLDPIDFEVIITTMHDSYMLEAIKHSAIDYLMKPISKSALAEAFDRFEQKKSRRAPQASSLNTARTNKLVIPNQEGLNLVEIEDILRLESDGPYTTIHLVNGEKEVSSKNLGTYESMLAKYPFYRVHHSHLINLNHVVNYFKGEGGHVVLSDQSIVAVSRRKKDDFLAALGA